MFGITEIFEGLFDSIAFEKHCEKNSWEKTNENNEFTFWGVTVYSIYRYNKIIFKNPLFSTWNSD